ncbi:hypothetical protein QL189_08995 [Cronobacter turicensis]|uniref:hypothetical protein n=1 Tax=Cronobacter turicensis TaxID=413502 RepID=UPI001D8DBA4A|nr:hypothetical protein [Cronobacter turicensis]EGT4490749.1 hypothetical protein [Cronobacter turicensis]MDI6417518.1 hypothetical protein [Cronobacter turicensis]MDI6464015.1 hypothetical protein [Cronobacter turicensis]MDI7673220.1 hypothetical protein [Cronobacter turicensis]
MSEISKERVEALASNILECHDVKPSEVKALAGLALLALRERAEPVAYPAPQDASPGWKIDPEFINKVQESIGYDEECECWEGAPSMEMVEAVLLAASKLKAPPAPVRVNQIAEQDRIASDIAGAYMQGCRDTEARLAAALPAPVVADETFDEWSRRCEIQLTLCRPEFREVAEITWNACRAAMLAAPGKDG